MEEWLSGALLDAANNRGTSSNECRTETVILSATTVRSLRGGTAVALVGSVKQREDTHWMADTNKALSHYL